MADLTPELLAQLEEDIASLTRHGEVRTSWAGSEVEVANGGYHVCDAPYKTGRRIARLINAAPALLTAAKAFAQRGTHRPSALQQAARQAARNRATLDGADAQALEHAVTITERERDAAAKERDQLRLQLEKEEADCLKIVDHRDASRSRTTSTSCTASRGSPTSGR